MTNAIASQLESTSTKKNTFVMSARIWDGWKSLEGSSNGIKKDNEQHIKNTEPPVGQQEKLWAVMEKIALGSEFPEM